MYQTDVGRFETAIFQEHDVLQVTSAGVTRPHTTKGPGSAVYPICDSVVLTPPSSRLMDERACLISIASLTLHRLRWPSVASVPASSGFISPRDIFTDEGTTTCAEISDFQYKLISL